MFVCIKHTIKLLIAITVKRVGERDGIKPVGERGGIKPVGERGGIKPVSERGGIKHEKIYIKANKN